VTTDDRQRFVDLSEEFFAAVVTEYPAWLKRSASAAAGGREVVGLDDAIGEATRFTRDGLDVLLVTDPDDYSTNPLSILRASTGPVTAVLVRAGVPPERRDAFLVEQFPEDQFDLNPASFGELDERLTEMGIAWGAALAYLHLQSHR